MDHSEGGSSETLYARLENKETGIIIAIQQRLHEDDLIQHLLNKEAFEHLNLPAFATEVQRIPLYLNRTFDRQIGDLLAPEYESLEVLEDTRRTMRDPAFSAQYQQDPTPPGGNRIRWEWFPRYAHALPRERYERVVQSIDTAFSELDERDYSVCLTLGLVNNVWHLLDVYQKRRNYVALRRDMNANFDRWQPDHVIIERTGVGWSLISDMREDVGPGKRGRILETDPHDNKETRLEVQAAKLERGLVALPEAAPWLEAFRREMLGFPNARHDDMVDALTQFLDWLSTPPGRRRLVPRDENGRRISVNRRDAVRRRPDN